MAKIAIDVTHLDNDYYPSYGNNPKTVNQEGQESFALSIAPKIKNIDASVFSGNLVITQELIDSVTEAVVSTLTKEIANLTLQPTEIRQLNALQVGQLPLVGVNVDNRPFVHRCTVAYGSAVLAEVLTGLTINHTDVYLSPSTPQLKGSSGSGNVVPMMTLSVPLTGAVLAKLGGLLQV